MSCSSASRSPAPAKYGGRVASLLAVVAFTAGAALGGRLAREPRPHRGRQLAAACLVQAVPVLASAIVVAVAGTGVPTRLVLVALLGAAMGGQNAVVRRLGVRTLRPRFWP
jgi:uncharacterized membrane protein YoaK (UPF0700 family)